MHERFRLELAPDRFRPAPFPDDAAPAVARARERDAARAAALWNGVGSGYWTERSRWNDARWRRHLGDDAIAFWIASDARHDIGFFELRRRATGVKLEGFGLLPAWRGRRLGGGLLSIATRSAFAAGARKIWLQTATDDHPHALKNYEARGYRIVRRSPLRHPMPARGSEDRARP